MKRLPLILAFLVLFYGRVFAEPAAAEVPLPAFKGATVDQWHGFKRQKFQVDGCSAWVVEPKVALPGKPWSWCMEFPDAFTDRCAAPQLLAAGFHHVHIKVGNTFGSPAAVKHFNAFYELLVAQGLAKKAALIGISRGGLYAYRFASEYPDRVAVIYGDAAVADFKSWPGGKGKGKGSKGDWAAVIACYGFKDEAEALAYPGNPIDRLEPLAKAKVALIHVVGDADDTVPPAENAAIIGERYKALGGTLKIIHKPGVGHHPHGLDDPTPVVKFILKHAAAPAPAQSGPRITVASYYFGNYHPGDPRNAKNKGKDWSEWELVKAAKPRFPGHQQPNVPLWGYTDESKPEVMAQKIAAAADHGIDAFIFDWYYYNDGPFLDRPIDEGFLKAKNNSRIKFAFMWANHDWIELQPAKRGAPGKVLYPGKVTSATFDKICDHVIKDYFSHPSYWKIDGRPYFSFYDLGELAAGFGGVEATRAALDRFRAQAVAAGLPGLHLNAVVWGQPILPGEKKPADTAQLVKDLGFDSVTSYVWIHHVKLPKLQTDYNEVRAGYFKYWDEAERKFSVPYYPNVTLGWDPSPRCNQDDEYGNFGYPFTNTIGGNTPERFKKALELTKQRLLSKPGGPRILNINCWNEWTEGSYLEPDQRNGMKYLEAVRDVFGAAPAAK